MPGGKPIVTLHDAAQYNSRLPKAEHDAPEAAMRALLLVVEHDGPTVFARIGVMKVSNSHLERVFNTSRNALLVKLSYDAEAEKRLAGLVCNFHSPFRTSFNWLV